MTLMQARLKFKAVWRKEWIHNSDIAKILKKKFWFTLRSIYHVTNWYWEWKHYSPTKVLEMLIEEFMLTVEHEKISVKKMIKQYSDD